MYYSDLSDFCKFMFHVVV